MTDYKICLFINEHLTWQNTIITELNTLLVGDKKECITLKLYQWNMFFLPNTKQFDHKIGIQLNNTLLVLEQNNYTSKIVNIFIAYDLDN